MAFAWMNQIFQFVGGIFYSTSPSPITAGSTGPMLGDQYGRSAVCLSTRGAPVNVGPTVWNNTTSLANGGVIKNAPCNLLRVFPTSTLGSTAYFQLFNKITAPALNDVPVFSFALLSTLPSFQLDFSKTSFPFATGCAWGISTTAPTYTSAGNVGWVTWELDQ